MINRDNAGFDGLTDTICKAVAKIKNPNYRKHSTCEKRGLKTDASQPQAECLWPVSGF